MGRSKVSENRGASGNSGGLDRAFAHRTQQEVHNAIDHHWIDLPDGSKSFLVDANNVDFHQLLTFWDALPLDLYKAAIALTMCGSSWYLALNYLQLGQIRIARNLTLNAGFLQEAYCTPMSDVVRAARSALPSHHVCRTLLDRFPRFNAAYSAALSPDTMQDFLTNAVPSDYQRMMNFASQTKSQMAQGPVREYVDLISNDWQESSRSSNSRNASMAQEKDAEIISIVLRDDDANQENKLQIGSSTTLKVLFSDYAKLRDVSLRSLRFSYEGRALFLSSAKKKTPKQLGMGHLAVITVTCISQISKQGETNARLVGSSNGSNPQHTSPRRKKGKKSKKGKRHARPHVAEKTQEELKIEHSTKLTKIHEEAQPRFKQIRQRLNNLSIKRSLPKFKPHRPKCVPPLAETINCSPATTGGKAGRSHYVVNIGEVQNLYKTSKPRRGPAASPRETSIDLHGLTKAKALDLLNEKLPQWNDVAMSGSYPFVIPVEIVCGGGNQILSEAVEKWIRRNDKVSNAPKNLWVPQRYFPCPFAS